MARTKSFDENKALESAMLLFWEKGYSATSMKALEQAMELKPTSIYNAFGSKRNLYQRSLNLYLQAKLAGFIKSAQSKKTAKDAIKDVLEKVIDLAFNSAHPGGCLLALSLMESEQHDAKTKKMFDAALSQLRDTITRCLEQAQDTGEIKQDTDCPMVANHIVALIIGMNSMTKGGLSKKDLQALISSSHAALIQQYWSNT